MSEHGHEHSASTSQRVKTLIAQLEDRGLLTEDGVDDAVERFLRGARYQNGARLVARAWRDPEFKQLLLSDANAAIETAGVDMRHWVPVRLRVVENTATTHNLLVCTLCSCYPVGLLGPSPKWYKSEAYRSRAVRDPVGVLAEFGVELAPEVTIRVWDSTSEQRYMVLPQRPAETEAFDEEQLAQLVTRNGLIGTALV